MFLWCLTNYVIFDTLDSTEMASYAPGPGTIFFSKGSLGALVNDTEGAVFILELKLDTVKLYLPTFGTDLSNLTKLPEMMEKVLYFFYFEKEKAGMSS
jgi:hypothetical protein